MRSLLRRFLCGCLVGLFLSTVALAQTDKLEKVRQSVGQHIAENEFIGAAIAYIDSSGQASFILDGTQKKGGQAVDKKTIFELGSITKVFTALAVADFLGRDKEVRLDSKAEPLLPEGYQLPEYKGKGITLQHLVTHTSALPQIPDNLPVSSANPYASYGDSLFQSYLVDTELSRAPGSQFQYSNSGMALAGRILEHQSDQSFEQIIKNKIVGPLQMQDTFVQISPEDSARFAQGHLGSEPAEYWNFNVFAPAGALRSTIVDMATFLSAQMSNTETTLSSAIKRSQQPLHDIQNKGPRLDKVGMGWIYETRKDTIMWHNGQTGGFRSFMGINTETNSGVVVLINGTAPIADIALYLLDADFELKEVQKNISLPVETLKKYVGEYKVTNQISYFVTLQDKQLYFRVSGQQKIPFYPKSKKRFYCKLIPAEIEFSVDSTGTVKRVTLFQNGREFKAQKLQKDSKN
ncbi:serine hydrolase [Fodinibius salinus]|nr:serine hydrolase [Fodinibius salinus]